MRRTLILALAVIVLAGCSSSGDPGAGADDTTTTTERTTTTLTPNEAFLSEIERSLDFGNDAGGGPATLALAQSICDSLTTNASIAADDAANDTPQTDASVIAAANGMGISAAFTGDSPDDVIAVVLRAGGEHLCPDHATTIEADLQARGL